MDITLHLLSHIIHLFFGIFVVFTAYKALESFKIIIWRRGWYFILFSGFFVILDATIEFFSPFYLVLQTINENPFFHIFNVITTYGLVAIGIFILSKTAKKMWGK